MYRWYYQTPPSLSRAPSPFLIRDGEVGKGEGKGTGDIHNVVVRVFPSQHSYKGKKNCRGI